MKTLVNKNTIRVAGGLLVLLMTAVLAVATVKSYATWEWNSGSCWHLSKTPIIPYHMFSCCGCCSAIIPWDYYTSPGSDVCASGPDSNGYGFVSCQTLTKDETVQTGYTVYGGNCNYGCSSIEGLCACLCNMTCTYHVTGTATVPVGYTVVSEGLGCYPEN